MKLRVKLLWGFMLVVGWQVVISQYTSSCVTWGQEDIMNEMII